MMGSSSSDLATVGESGRTAQKLSKLAVVDTPPSFSITETSKPSFAAAEARQSTAVISEHETASPKCRGTAISTVACGVQEDTTPSPLLMMFDHKTVNTAHESQQTRINRLRYLVFRVLLRVAERLPQDTIHLRQRRVLPRRPPSTCSAANLLSSLLRLLQ